MEEGDKVIKVIEGGGFRTATFQIVDTVNSRAVTLRDSDLVYDAHTLDEMEPPLPGFRSYLVALDGGQGELVDWEQVANSRS